MWKCNLTNYSMINRYYIAFCEDLVWICLEYFLDFIALLYTFYRCLKLDYSSLHIWAVLFLQGTISLNINVGPSCPLFHVYCLSSHHRICLGSRESMTSTVLYRHVQPSLHCSLWCYLVSVHHTMPRIHIAPALCCFPYSSMVSSTHRLLLT